MQNKYEIADQKGRDIVINMFPRVQFTEGQMSDRYDLESNTINGRSLIEIKFRPDLKSTSWDTDILEYEKLSAIRNEDRKAQHFYFMLFSDGVGRLYNLADISIMDVYINTKECPVSSTEDKGDIEKLMIELPINKAKVYKFNKMN